MAGFEHFQLLHEVTLQDSITDRRTAVVMAAVFEAAPGVASYVAWVRGYTMQVLSSALQLLGYNSPWASKSCRSLGLSI